MCFLLIAAMSLLQTAPVAHQVAQPATPTPPLKSTATSLELVQSQGLDSTGQSWSGVVTIERPMTRNKVVTTLEKRKGVEVEIPRYVPYQVMGTIIESRTHPIDEIRVFLGSGKELAGEEKAAALKRGTVLLLARGSDLDPKWRKLLAADAIIVLAPRETTPAPATAAPNTQPAPGVPREAPSNPIPPS